MGDLSGIHFERRGEGSPLLLVHGLGSRWEVWSRVLDDLAAHHDVVAVDLPGFGRSPRPPKGTRPGVSTFSDRLQGLIAELGWPAPHVAGNSMGGWIALELARRGAVASATALSPAGFIEGADRAWTVPLLALLRLTVTAGKPALPAMMNSAAVRRVGLAAIAAHGDHLTPAEAIVNLDGLAGASWYWANLRAVGFGRFLPAGQLSAPVTIAWGDKDRILLPKEAATAIARVPGARFLSLPDCGHVPMFDNPGLVVQTILETTRVLTAA